jgi:hypothetical protein
MSKLHMPEGTVLLTRVCTHMQLCPQGQTCAHYVDKATSRNRLGSRSTSRSTSLTTQTSPSPSHLKMAPPARIFEGDTGLAVEIGPATPDEDTPPSRAMQPAGKNYHELRVGKARSEHNKGPPCTQVASAMPSVSKTHERVPDDGKLATARPQTST